MHQLLVEPIDRPPVRSEVIQLGVGPGTRWHR
jgi:hypothetical protein